MQTGSISVVVPTYNVAPYLPEFMNSLDAQTGDVSSVEIVFVNDGSTDESGELIEQWRARTSTPMTTRVLTKPNGGLSSARNAGLDVARGEWVTFCDPDDVLTPDYLGIMTNFVRSKKAATVHLVAGNFVYLNDETGTTSATHPLRFRFAEGDRIVDLERHPHFIHVAANTGLFRRELLDQWGLRYDPQVRPVWEDGHLTAKYLAKFERPRIAMMADAVYLYRRRADGSSLMQGSWTTPGKYLNVPRYGWLDALCIIQQERSHVPRYIQNIILYDMLGYFRQERRSPSPTGAVPREVSDEFYSILDEVLLYIDVDAIEGFKVTNSPFEIRKAIVLGLKGADSRPSEISVDELDEERGLVRLRYYYSGQQPVEVFHARGYQVAPVFEKVRDCAFYGRTLMYERTVWMPANGTIAVTLDGAPIPLRPGPLEAKRYSLGPYATWMQLRGEPPPFDSKSTRKPSTVRARGGKIKRQLRTLHLALQTGRAQRRAKDALLVKAAHSSWARLKYRNAWLLIDRDTQAQDNAEHLYRYLREHQPQVNAWFVVSRQSNDWVRLRNEGFRLIDHGSRQHKIALLNCAHLLSSQIDWYITSPLPAWRYGAKNVNKWHYTFLQHGVTKDDLSIWINTKPISLMITATPDEHESIVGHGSPYVFSEREIRMTGFPRHDRLLKLAYQRRSRDEARLLLIMPTWRRELLLDSKGGNDRELRHDFWESSYAVHWRSVLESERLHTLAAAKGWDIAFVPHPNMQSYLDESPLPEHVRVHRFRDIDIQQMLANAGALVTDYSSMGFEMAYLERPVVYFQFDQDTFFSGTHAYRQGTWSYERDGFGPVTVDGGSAIEQIAAVIERDGKAEPLYADRMRDTFPFRDGFCSQRTYEAVVDITRRLSDDELYLKLEPNDELQGTPVVIGDTGASHLTAVSFGAR